MRNCKVTDKYVFSFLINCQAFFLGGSLENMFARALYLKTRPTGEEMYVPSFQTFAAPDSLNQRIPRWTCDVNCMGKPH